jgi:acetylornithine/succinyldiaminopimelate/putrescine aminotransferase/predicted amino acid dehydrogenase
MRPEARGARLEQPPRGSDAPEGADPINPELHELLGRFRFDLEYVRASGPYLYDAAGVEYLDLCTNYGALPLGHNPPEMWQALLAAREAAAPALVRPGYPAAARELARRLVALAPGRMHAVTYAVSGGEAVEAACDAARAATGRPLIVVAQGGFHGGPLGDVAAANLTGAAAAGAAAADPHPRPDGFVEVPYGDPAALERALRLHPHAVAGFLVEPIQGEGGVVVPADGYLAECQRLCREHGALLLVDEVLTGLGRLGVMFASAAAGIEPDAIILSKALGGGLVPMAACLHARTCWSTDYALGHSSTFAGHGLGAACGLRMLDVLEADGGALLRRVAAQGERLLAALKAIAAEHPTVVAEARGRGLLCGVRVGPATYVPGTSLRAMAEAGYLGPVLCGYLLHRDHVRLVPGLSEGRVLRITPSLRVADEQLDRLVAALRRAAGRIARGDLRELIGYLLGRNEPLPEEREFRPERTPGHPPITEVDTRCREAPADAGRFAFLVHPLDLLSYAELEPSFVGAPEKELAALGDMLHGLFPPVAMSRVALRSAAGAWAEGHYICTTLNSFDLLGRPQAEVLAELKRMVALGRALGARVVGLGALTAVAAKAGTLLADEGVPVTTGNSLTVHAATEGLLLAAAKMGLDFAREEAAVVGAPGSIGRIMSHLLARRVKRLTLVGNPKAADSMGRLRELADEISTDAGSAADLRLSTDVADVLPGCRLVVSATSDPGTVIDPAWIASGAVVCDVARPPDVSLEVRRRRDDVLVIDGGVMALPERITLGFGFGHERGMAFACMSETMVLALERRYEPFSFGRRLDLARVREIAGLAEKHGFRVAALRTFGRPISDAEVAAIRARARR